MKVFLFFPSDDGDSLNGIRDFGNANYVLNQGMQPDGIQGSPFLLHMHPIARGPFHMNSWFNFSSISDGLSNTFAVGERDTKHEGSLWLGVGIPADGPYGTTRGIGRTHIHLNIPVTNNDLGQVIDPLTRDMKGFSSRHPGGANFCLLDGSVRFVSDTINSVNDATVWAYNTGITDGSKIGVYQCFSVRDDGRSVSLP